MHVAHLDDQVIATRFVLSSVIPLRGVPELRPCERRARQRYLSNGITQQTPRAASPESPDAAVYRHLMLDLSDLHLRQPDGTEIRLGDVIDRHTVIDLVRYFG